MVRRTVRLYRDAFRTIGSAQGGSIVLIWALALLVVISAAGGAIDYATAVNVRAKIAANLDAATLSGARYLATSNDVDKAQALIVDTFNQSSVTTLQSQATIEEITAKIDSQSGVITTFAQAHIKTAFVQLLGISEIPVSVGAEVSFGSKNIEVALVLDVTGSMKSDMVGLRAAAQSVVDSLVPAGTLPRNSKVRIALVPYSQGVNLGEYAHKVSNGQAGIQNCVTERFGAQQYTDATYDYAGTSSVFFGGGSDGCAPTPQMEPLTNKRNKLTAAVSKLSAAGYTAGQTGIGWGWYALSPKWSNLWRAESMPGQYDDSDLLKFAIIMTDGDFNTYYDYGPSESCNKKKKNHDDDEKFQPCGTSSAWQEVRESQGYGNVSSTRARKLCTEMKASGMTLYTVYFGNDASSSGARVMENCASSADSYLMASSETELVVAFQGVAQKIKAIYLSK